MIKKIYLIGIGPGHPRYLTLEAVELIKKLPLFLLPLKQGKKKDLTEKRKEIILGLRKDKNFRIIEIPFPERKKASDYKNAVSKWRNEKVEILEKVLLREKDREAGFLVWGDPSLYDGHIEIFKELRKKLAFELEVIPGISAFQVLSARHRISLTSIAGSLIFTTPRKLKTMLNLQENTLVFLDNYETYSRLEEDFQIYWGAYLGTEKEVLISGKLYEVKEKIQKLRRELRKKYGWIMELYFLKIQEK